MVHPNGDVTNGVNGLNLSEEEIWVMALLETVIFNGVKKFKEKKNDIQ